MFLELEHELASVSIVVRVQPIVTAAVSMLNERLGGFRIAKQVLLHIGVDLLQVGLGEKRAIQVIDVLGQLLHPYASLTDVGENLQYLFVVHHHQKKVGSETYRPFSIIQFRY